MVQITAADVPVATERRSLERPGRAVLCCHDLRGPAAERNRAEAIRLGNCRRPRSRVLLRPQHRDAPAEARDRWLPQSTNTSHLLETTDVAAVRSNENSASAGSRVPDSFPTRSAVGVLGDCRFDGSGVCSSPRVRGKRRQLSLSRACSRRGEEQAARTLDVPLVSGSAHLAGDPSSRTALRRNAMRATDATMRAVPPPPSPTPYGRARTRRSTP
jgi:hypothetical protein